MCPRIRLTKTDNSRAIIPIDAISGIEEDKCGKCVRINTMDGFSYDVINTIVEVDKKIDESIMRVNGSVPIVIPNNLQTENEEEAYENAKVARFKKKRMLSAGVDKPARRVAALTQRARTDPPTQTTESVENKSPQTKEQTSSTEDAKEKQ